jgi:hypothetical protein
LFINKNRSASLNAEITITNFLPWTNAIVRSYGIPQDEAARTNGPAAAQDIATNKFAIAGPQFSAIFPPYSVTLLTIPPAEPLLSVLPASTDRLVLQVQGQPEARYVLQSSTNLVNWVSTATNASANGTWNVTNNLGSPLKFWRATWLSQK